MRSTTLAAPLLLELQRAILERGAWPLLRVELPGETRRSTRTRATCTSTTSRRSALDGGQAGRRGPRASRRRPTRASSRTSTRSAIARVARAAQAVREQTLKKRWCTTLWPTEAGAAARPG